jgi:hypothetical protein
VDLRSFAEQDRLKISRDNCGDAIIDGRHGHIYGWADDGSIFGVMILGPGSKYWGHARREFRKCGNVDCPECNGRKALLSKQDAAQALSVSVRTNNYLIGNDELPTRRIGRRTLIPRSGLELFALQDHPESPSRQTTPVENPGCASD